MESSSTSSSSNFDSYLDKSQLPLEAILQVKQIKSFIADPSITLSLQSITSYYKDENHIIVGTTIGNILIMDSNLKKILQFFNLSAESEQYASYIGPYKDQSVIIGANNGAIYQMQDASKGHIKKLCEAKNRHKVTNIYPIQGGLIVAQDQNVIIIDLELDTQLYIDIMLDYGKVTQISTDYPKNKLLLISTSKLNHFVYNMNSSILCPIGQKQKDITQNYSGSAYYQPSQRFLFTQPNSLLWHVNNVTYQVEYSTTYKSKKVKDLKFGSLFCINNECLLSINPEDSLVLINLQTNRLLTYEQLKSFDRYQYNENNRYISLLGQNEDNKLIINDYQVMNLLEAFNELVESNKLKAALKMVLKQKSLQRIEIIQQLLVKIFRKQQKPDISETKEYSVFIEIVNLLESEKNRSNNQAEKNEIGYDQLDDDEGFGSLEEPSAESNEQNLKNDNLQQSLSEKESPESMSEILLRQRAIEFEQKKRREQEKLAERIYKENKKINRKMRMESFMQWFDKVFLARLLFRSFPNDVRMLKAVLADKERTREESVLLILNQNTFYSLVEMMDFLKFTSFPFALRMIQFKYWELDIDMSIFFNGRLNSKYYLRYIAVEIYQMIKLTRLQLKERSGIELDEHDRYWKNEFLRIMDLIQQQKLYYFSQYQNF